MPFSDKTINDRSYPISLLNPHPQTLRVRLSIGREKHHRHIHIHILQRRLKQLDFREPSKNIP